MSSISVDNINTSNSKTPKPGFFKFLWNKYLSFFGKTNQLRIKIPVVKDSNLDAKDSNLVVKDMTPRLLTFTLHLPGLMKTVQFSYLPKEQDKPNGKSMDGNYMFSQFVCETFNVVYRRAQLYLLRKDGIAKEICYSKISDGDTLILVVRPTIDESQNEYYNNQQDSLKNNKYLEPSITKYQAASLLADIKTQFNLIGWKNWMPGGTGYQYKQYFLKNVTNYPDDKE
jgi:hypothetical protein